MSRLPRFVSVQLASMVWYGLSLTTRVVSIVQIQSLHPCWYCLDRLGLSNWVASILKTRCPRITLSIVCAFIRLDCPDYVFVSVAPCSQSLIPRCVSIAPTQFIHLVLVESLQWICLDCSAQTCIELLGHLYSVHLRCLDCPCIRDASIVLILFVIIDRVASITQSLYVACWLGEFLVSRDVSIAQNYSVVLQGVISYFYDDYLYLLFIPL